MEKKKVIFFLAGALVLITTVFLPGYSELQRLREKSGQYRKRIELLEKENSNLRKEFVTIHKDPVYLEKKAREKLGIVKKGEIIYKKNGETDKDAFLQR